MTIALAAVLAYIRFWRMKRISRQPYQNIELEANPSVLILYTDDCEEHTNTVLALAELLKRDANVRVLIDQFDFTDPRMCLIKIYLFQCNFLLGVNLLNFLK